MTRKENGLQLPFGRVVTESRKMSARNAEKKNRQDRCRLIRARS